MESVAILKSKNILRNNWAILIVIFGSTFALSGYQMHQEYINPSFEEKNITASSYTQYGTYFYSTMVSEPNSLYLTGTVLDMNLIHISEPTRLGMISYAVFCLKKK